MEIHSPDVLVLVLLLPVSPLPSILSVRMFLAFVRRDVNVSHNLAKQICFPGIYKNGTPLLSTPFAYLHNFLLFLLFK